MLPKTPCAYPVPVCPVVSSVNGVRLSASVRPTRVADSGSTLTTAAGHLFAGMLESSGVCSGATFQFSATTEPAAWERMGPDCPPPRSLSDW